MSQKQSNANITNPNTEILYPLRGPFLEGYTGPETGMSQDEINSRINDFIASKVCFAFGEKTLPNCRSEIQFHIHRTNGLVDKVDMHFAQGDNGESSLIRKMSIMGMDQSNLHQLISKLSHWYNRMNESSSHESKVLRFVKND